jgi:hypothetical protein
MEIEQVCEETDEAEQNERYPGAQEPNRDC